jgi:uncharacterized protein (DUF1501 family)
MSMFSRRQLLAMSGLTGGAVYLGASPFASKVFAQGLELQDRYFIFCYFNGGWDLLLGLDPRDPAIFRDDLRKSTLIETGYSELPSSRRELVETSVDGMVFGPYIGALADHADKLCVVRGMSMDTLTHEVGRRRFLTGQPPAGLQAQGSSLATVLADRLGGSEPIPNLSVRVESYNEAFETWASGIRVSSVEDLVRALSPAPHSLSGDEQAAIDALLAEFGACPGAQRSTVIREGLAGRGAAQDLVALGLDARFDFGANTAEMEALRDLYGIGSDLADASAQAAAAVTAITAGISRCVSIEIADGLDTHGPEWSAYHGPSMEDGFDLMAAILSDLDSREYGNSGESWLSRTTVVGFSEFGRSTLLNSSGGRDHFIHNACVLAGGGVTGGKVIGASSDLGMTPQAVDLATGELDLEEGTTIKPEQVFRALLQGVGIEDDIAGLEAEALTAIHS